MQYGLSTLYLYVLFEDLLKSAKMGNQTVDIYWHNLIEDSDTPNVGIFISDGGTGGSGSYVLDGYEPVVCRANVHVEAVCSDGADNMVKMHQYLSEFMDNALKSNSVVQEIELLNVVPKSGVLTLGKNKYNNCLYAVNLEVSYSIVK